MAKFAAVKSFVRSEEGATMVEYGLLVAAIALVVVVGAKTFGTSLSGFFTSAAGSL
jgi:pilus assembly protein Flp/PilA